MVSLHNSLGLITIGASSLLFLAVPHVANSQPVATTVTQFAVPTYEKKALPKKLNTAEAWQTVANNAFVAQDYYNSLAAYNKAIDLAPAGDRAVLLEERGWVHYRLSHYGRAKTDFQAAATLYKQQEQSEAFQNVQQMRRFVETQAQRFDSVS